MPIIDDKELKKDCIYNLVHTHDLSLVEATKIVDDTFLERVIDRMYEAQANEIAWQLTKRS